MKDDQPAEFYAKQLVDLHTDWFKKCKAAHKPIIGGMSGHTLGYLSIYKNAVESLLKKGGNAEGLPSLDTFRAIMLAALIGNKRHHSYDEVFSAAAAMPDPVTNKVLKYAHRNSYADVFKSDDEHVRKAANHALKQTIEDVENPEPKITVLDYIRKNYFSNNTQGFHKLIDLLKLYLNNHAKPEMDIEN